MAGNRDFAPRHIVSERHYHRQTGRLHPRERPRSCEKLAVKVGALNLRVADFAGVECDVEYVGWIETEIGMLSALETADKQTRDNQERGRACHLRCDEHGAGALATAGKTTSTFVQDVAEISGRDSQ